MTIGIVALVVAIAAAAVLLLRVAKGEGAGGDNITMLKFVVLLGLAAALFAAKLWPIAFMVLIAAGGVMAIESWRDKHIADVEPASPPAQSAQVAMTTKEAAAILGIADDANGDEIRTAYRKLISQIHPDKGGTDYLAAKINEAHEVMLRSIENTDD